MKILVLKELRLYYLKIISDMKRDYILGYFLFFSCSFKVHPVQPAQGSDGYLGLENKR